MKTLQNTTSESQNQVSNRKESFYSKRLFIARATAMMRNNNMTRSEAFKKAWEIVKLYHRLLTEKSVSFIYIKKDGSYRKATATLTDPMRKENPYWKANEVTFPYFDVNSNGIRSFICANFVKCC